MWGTAVRLVHTRLSRAYLCECVRLCWDYLHCYSGIFYSCQFIKSFRPFHSFWEEDQVILENQYKLYRMTSLSYQGYSVSVSSSQQCGGTPLKLLCLFSSILVHYTNFSRQSLIKVPKSIKNSWLSVTWYKPKLSHGMTCHFMLDSLHWCAKQRNRTSMLLGELWYTYQSI